MIRTAQRKGASRPDTPRPSPSGSWLLAFVWTQFALQVLLLLPALNQTRVYVRGTAFISSIALLILLPMRRKLDSWLHRWVWAVLIIVGLQALNPESRSPMASLAQFALYLAIIGPVFWVPRLAVSGEIFQRLLLSFWFFYLASATVGVLEVLLPGWFQPTLSTVIESHGADYVDSLQIELASGDVIFRPMGLTDVPGGAAQGGLYAVLFGMGALQARRLFRGAHGLGLVSLLVGAMCLYLCHVRALLVMTGICVAAMTAILALSGRFSRLLGVGVGTLSAALVAFVLAESVGGESMLARLSTLIEADAGTVYYVNRGVFLEDTINNLLPMYPLGAGLGRWGMMGRYFGSGMETIFVEIQWTGWLLDGGVPLILAYVAALVSVGAATFRIAIRPAQGGPATWAPTIVAYNIGALALCFNYAVFIGTAGIEFWLLNATLLRATIWRDPPTAPAATSELRLPPWIRQPQRFHAQPTRRQ